LRHHQYRRPDTARLPVIIFDGDYKDTQHADGGLLAYRVGHGLAPGRCGRNAVG
jgi:hypothetical protein